LGEGFSLAEVIHELVEGPIVAGLDIRETFADCE